MPSMVDERRSSVLGITQTGKSFLHYRIISYAGEENTLIYMYTPHLKVTRPFKLLV